MLRKTHIFIITLLLCLVLSACVPKDLPGEPIADSLQPTVEIGIEEYTPIMSSVPGYPFVCKGENIASVVFSVDNGGLLLWGPDDFRVKPQGKEVTVESGISVYWSPLTNTQDLPTTATITVTINMADGKTYSQQISIYQTDESGFHYYKARLIK